MFIGPGGSPARRMNDAKNRVRPDKIPGINRSAVAARIADQLHRVDGTISPVGKTGARDTTIKHRLIEVHSFFVLGRRAWKRSRRARTVKQSIARVDSRGRQHPIVSYVIVGTM